MKYVFGPVSSWRLGRSLGIDPIAHKTCNWNCVYCQLGRTRPLVCERKEYLPAKQIVAEVAQVLSAHPAGDIDWVTFVGSGEPLLHVRLGWMIRQIGKLTDIPIAVITNGSLLYRAEVRDELAAADAVLPSLDAGSPELYRRLNRPHPEFTYKRLLDGLRSFRRAYRGSIWLEVMLVRSVNDEEPALREIAQRIQAIEPDQIHINLPYRPPAEAWVEPADGEGIMRAVAIMGEVAPVRVASPTEGTLDLAGYESPVEAIAAVIARHPLPQEEIERTLAHWGPDNIRAALSELENSGRARTVSRYGVRFWTAATAYHAGSPESEADLRLERCRPRDSVSRAAPYAEASSYAVDEVLRDGTRLRIRAIRPDDKDALRELFGRLSREAIYYRFLGAKKRLTPGELAELTELDFHRKAALVACLDDEGRERVVAVGRYACAPGGPDDRAEVALTVEDAMQSRGIGTLLLKHLIRVAAAEGVRCFDAYLLADNHRMVHLLEKTGRVTHRSAEGGICHLVVSLPDPDPH